MKLLSRELCVPEERALQALERVLALPVAVGGHLVGGQSRPLTEGSPAVPAQLCWKLMFGHDCRQVLENLSVRNGRNTCESPAHAMRSCLIVEAARAGTKLVQRRTGGAECACSTPRNGVPRDATLLSSNLRNSVWRHLALLRSRWPCLRLQHVTRTLLHPAGPGGQLQLISHMSLWR